VVHEPHVYLLSPRFGGSLDGRGFLLHCERGNLLVYSSSTLEADLKRSRSSAALSANTSTTATKRYPSATGSLVREDEQAEVHRRHEPSQLYDRPTDP
jgi:hypothetical protein